MFTREKYKNIKKTEQNSDNSGVVRNKYGTGIRSFLVDSGLNNSDIDYDIKNNKVTYKGKPIMTPNSVIDGVSYANEDSLRTVALDIHNGEGKNLVSAGDYAAQKTGIENAVSIDNGYVSVGQSVIKPVVVYDGTAYVEKDIMDEVLDLYLNEIDYKSEKEIYDDWYNQYGERIEEKLSELEGEKWEYNPENDPAYQAYAELYRREGQRAFEDAYGDLISNTGGFTNSAALTAANQGLNYYMQQLGDKIPELMADDYERFANEREGRISAVNQLIDFADEIYEKQYSANSDYIDRIEESNNRNYERKLTESREEREDALAGSQIYNNYLDGEDKLIDIEYKPKLYEAQLTESELKRMIDEIELEYLPLEKSSELKSDFYEQLLASIEAKYLPRLYESELQSDEKDRALTDTQIKYYRKK